MRALAQALRRGRRRPLVTLGIRPTRPETGYGYIELGARTPAGRRARTTPVHLAPPPSSRSPTAPRAARLPRRRATTCGTRGCSSFPRARILDELHRHLPALGALLDEHRRAPRRAPRCATPRRRRSPSTTRSWRGSACEHVGRRGDPRARRRLRLERRRLVRRAAGAAPGRRRSGNHVVAGTSRSASRRRALHRSTRAATWCGTRGHQLVAALGVDDLVVAVTDDAVLVMPRERAQDVREVVDAACRRRGRGELPMNPRVFREYDIRGVAERDLDRRRSSRDLGPRARHPPAPRRRARASPSAATAALHSPRLHARAARRAAADRHRRRRRRRRADAAALLRGVPPATPAAACRSPAATTRRGQRLQDHARHAAAPRRRDPGAARARRGARLRLPRRRARSASADIERRLPRASRRRACAGPAPLQGRGRRRQRHRRRRSAVPLLRALGFEVTPLYCELDGRFPNHHPDPDRAREPRRAASDRCARPAPRSASPSTATPIASAWSTAAAASSGATS